MKAGVLLAAEGLDDPGKGVVVDFKELFGGFFLLDVASKQEAVEWTKRVPAVPGSKDVTDERGARETRSSRRSSRHTEGYRS